MAIQVADNFSYQGKKPLDGRTEYGTIAAMVAVSESILNDGCLAYVKENKKYYTFDSNNTIDSTLGKWRELESGSTITIDPTPTSGSTNAVQSGGTYTALEGKVDKVTGKQLSTEDFTTAEKTKLDGINLSNYIPTSQKGANSGVAELDANGKVPSTQLPSYVDDVVSKATKSEFPNPGEDDKIYIAKDENASYRWDGTEYVSISSANGLTLGETSSTAYRGDRGKTAYDDSQANKTNIGTMANLTTTEKTNLVGAVNEVNGGLANKVDKVTGKGLSTNDYDNTEKGKVTNAQPQTLSTAKTIEGASVTTVQGVADAVQTHTDKVVTGADGVHGFKVTTSGGTKMYYKSGANWVEIEVGSSTQVSTLPTASQSNVGVVYQYIGSTTSVAPIYKHGYFYECVENSGVYSWVNIPVMDVQEVQKTTLPTASATELGNIYQFVGTTTSSYTKGYYYECKAKGTEPETYEWQAISVQAGGGGADSRISEEVTEIGVKLSNGFRPYIKIDLARVIPSFSEMSLSDLAIITDSYYNGDISISDIKQIWSEGDTLDIDLSAMSATDVAETHEAQTVSLKIIDFEHDNLTTPINGKTKSFMTFAFLLNENGILASNNATGWDGMARRTWCNDTCFNALPLGLKEIVKSVDRDNGSGQAGYTTLVTSSDLLFLANYKEFMGDISLSEIVPSSSGYSSVDAVDGTESTQYELYKTVANRQFGKDVLTATTARIYHSGVARYYDNTMLFILSDGRIKNGDIPSISCGLLVHGNI